MFLKLFPDFQYIIPFNNFYNSINSNYFVNLSQPIYILDLPAKQMSREIKYGFLTWKTKIIFKLEKNRQVFAGIHNGYLLIYSCEKDNKPSHTFNLKMYRVQECENSTKQMKSFNLYIENSKLIHVSIEKLS